MDSSDIKKRDFSSEWSFTTSRSSGPGGQNVNKVNSRVELRFNINESEILTEEEKKTALKKLAGKLTLSGELIIFSQEHRSQLKNREVCIEKFYELLSKALKKRKPRKATKPTASSIAKRLETKKRVSEKKKLRKADDL